MRDKKTRVNEQIRIPKVRLIDQDGKQVGVVSTRDALDRAKEVDLDLVEISPNADPPVCRIMDYGKYLFEQNKRKAAAKKKQKITEIKEIKFRPSTDTNDFNVKVRKINSFLERGDKVKISLRFRGREMQHKELGLELLQRIKSHLPEGYVVEQEAKLEGRQMSMVVLMGNKLEKKITKRETENAKAEN